MRYSISFAMAILAPVLGLATAARAEVPKVVTDIPPVGALVSQVMGDLGQPEVLLTGGANAHDFQLRPSQARALNGADLVVWVGPELTPWLGRTLSGINGVSQLGLLAAPGTYLRVYGAAPEDHAHAHDDHQGEDHDDHDDHAAPAPEGHDHAEDDHDHDDEAHDDQDGHDHEGHDHDGHAHTGTDPHAWLDPANAQVWLQAIAAELSRLDPEHAATYARNAEDAVAQVAALNGQIADRLRPVRSGAFVTFHDAYGYFTDHFGLSPLGAISAGDAHSPGAARLAALRASIGQADICLFPEVQHDPALISQMAEATGSRVGGALDPEGTAIEPGPGAYARVLEGIADTLLACLKK